MRDSPSMTMYEGQVFVVDLVVVRHCVSLLQQKARSTSTCIVDGVG